MSDIELPEQEWCTVEVQTHPMNDAKWVAVIERIRNNVTGEVREHHSHSPLRHGEPHPDTFIWEEGNYACDCNRALFWGYAAGKTYEEVGEHPCGDGGYSVQLVNPVTGDVFYDEFDIPPSPQGVTE